MGLPPEPPDEQQPPPPPPPIEAEGGECPRCGTPYEPFQEYCLECGLRLPVTRGLIPVLSTAWRRRIPWYPGDWIWSAIGLLIVAALAAAIAILATTDNGSSTKTTAGTGVVPANTAGPPPPPETDTATTATETTATETTPTTTEPAPLPPPPPSTELIEWPAGQSGWTIVLSSSPQSSGRAAAASVGRQAIDAGLTDVGVLNSDEYSSLHPGYFVVFTGIYSSESEARGALDAAKGFKPQAYPREITQ